MKVGRRWEGRGDREERGSVSKGREVERYKLQACM